MNTQEYISSGTLELYAMGVLSAEEATEVAAMVAQHKEVAEELGNIEAALGDFATGMERFPRPNMKSRIMNAIAENEKEGIPISSIKTEAVIRSIGGTAEQNNTFKYAAAASIAVLLASNLLFINKWQGAEKRFSEAIAQNYRLADNYKLTKNLQEKIQSDFNIATNHNYKVVELKGQALAPTANAYVYWNATTKEAFIDVRSLPIPSPDMQYQLWALVNGKPVDAGVFDIAASNGGLQKVKNVAAAQAFAVTLEKKGGSPVPTLTAMYLMAQI